MDELLGSRTPNLVDIADRIFELKSAIEVPRTVLGLLVEYGEKHTKLFDGLEFILGEVINDLNEIALALIQQKGGE